MTTRLLLVDSLGSDKRVVNAARVSYATAGIETPASADPLSDGDIRLLKYLASHRHMSPFRHCAVTLYCEAPEFVARQAYKHVVGIAGTGDQHVVDHAWNEVSGRYVELHDVWAGPSEWRGPPGKGQSSGSVAGALCDEAQMRAQLQYCEAVKEAFARYNTLLHLGVCKEQARAVLPMSFMTRWFWTLSLEAAAHFCALRLAPDSQAEIREMAEKMDSILVMLFPNAYLALKTHGDDSATGGGK